jgi:MSHA biogenesis protein MshO
MVEMVTVIAITSIVAAAAAVFLKYPLQEYQDAQRRAVITDAADTAFSRIKRDLQTALPNSVRVSSVGAVFYLEFLQMRTGGRYRAQLSATPALVCNAVAGDAQGDVLAFGVSDTCFTTLGSLSNLASIVNTDFLVIYNLGAGFTNADAYVAGGATTGNKSAIVAVGAGAGGENVVRFAAHKFTLDSPGQRFQIVSGPVTYICDPGAGTVSRISAYSIAAAQPMPPVGTTALLARNISACTITYDQNVINQRVGVVSIALGFADATSATAVNLFQQVQIGNVP